MLRKKYRKNVTKFRLCNFPNLKTDWKFVSVRRPHWHQRLITTRQRNTTVTVTLLIDYFFSSPKGRFMLCIITSWRQAYMENYANTQTRIARKKLLQPSKNLNNWENWVKLGATIGNTEWKILYTKISLCCYVANPIRLELYFFLQKFWDFTGLGKGINTIKELYNCNRTGSPCIFY